MNKGKKKSSQNATWLWALKWAVLIVLSPILIPFYYLPKGMWWMFRKGSKAILWDNFLSYIKGHVARDDDGAVKYIRFVSYSDFVHVHYCIWGLALTGLIAWLAPSTDAVMALFIIGLPIFSWMVVNYDIPFDKAWKPVLIMILLVPAADYGLSQLTYHGTNFAFPWIEENAAWTGITAEMAGSYEVLWLVDKLFIWFGLTASPGMHFFASLAWGAVFILTVAEAWFYNRFELDRRELVRHMLFRKSSRDPIYMRRLEVVLKDVLEVFPFGFSSLRVEVRGQLRRFPNIPGLAFRGWLGGAFEQMINYSSDDSSSRKKKSESPEDEADLVQRFEEEEAAADGHHGPDDHDDRGDIQHDDDDSALVEHLDDTESDHLDDFVEEDI